MQKLIFDGGNLLEFPSDLGQLVDQGIEHGGVGAIFHLKMAKQGIKSRVGWGFGGGEAVFGGILGTSGFAFGGAWAGGEEGVGAIGGGFAG